MPHLSSPSSKGQVFLNEQVARFQIKNWKRNYIELDWSIRNLNAVGRHEMVAHQMVTIDISQVAVGPDKTVQIMPRAPNRGWVKTIALQYHDAGWQLDFPGALRGEKKLGWQST